MDLPCISQFFHPCHSNFFLFLFFMIPALYSVLQPPVFHSFPFHKKWKSMRSMLVVFNFSRLLLTPFSFPKIQKIFSLFLASGFSFPFFLFLFVFVNIAECRIIFPFIPLFFIPATQIFSSPFSHLKYLMCFSPLQFLTPCSRLPLRNAKTVARSGYLDLCSSIFHPCQHF